MPKNNSLNYKEFKILIEFISAKSYTEKELHIIIEPLNSKFRVKDNTTGKKKHKLTLRVSYDDTWYYLQNHYTSELKQKSISNLEDLMKKCNIV